MEFYKHLKIWQNAVTGVIDALYLIESEASWQCVINKEHEIKEWLSLIKQYEFRHELEGFALEAEQRKINGLFKTIDSLIDSWLEKWRLGYKHEDDQEFYERFCELAIGKLHKELSEVNRIARLVHRMDNHLINISRVFEQVKSSYTTIPPRTIKSFYDRIKDRLKTSIESPVKYTFDDWLNGTGADGATIRHYINFDRDIQRLMWQEKWPDFNEWVEHYFRQTSDYCNDSPEELIDAITNSITLYEGNLSILFSEQEMFYPPSELKKIYAEMGKIYPQVISDNWHYFQKRIDSAIHGSLDSDKLITDLIYEIDCFFEGRDTELTYPLYKPYNTSQQVVIEAYRDLFRGYKDITHVRPHHRMEDLSIEEEQQDNALHFQTGSPFVEAELLIKAREYLNQRLEKLLIESSQISPPSGLTNGRNIISYKWQASKEGIELDLTTLYDLLSSRQYISQTSLMDFKAAFSGANIETFQSIKWIPGPSELLYFIHTLSEMRLIEDCIKPMSYLKLMGCFVKSNGLKFECDFKGLNQKLDIDLSSEKKESIKALLKILL